MICQSTKYRLELYFCIQIRTIQLLIYWKILALAGIWTWDLPGTKSTCYQLSYPGLDQSLYLKINLRPDFSQPRLGFVNVTSLKMYCVTI